MLLLFLCTDESFPSIAIAAIATGLSLILLLLILIGIMTSVCAAITMNKKLIRTEVL